MQRSLALVVLVVLALAGALVWFLSRSDVAPPVPPPVQESAAPAPGPADASVQVDLNPGNGDTGPRRVAVEGVLTDLLDDPEIRAGLCGFRGRVVDHEKSPVADTGVRIYRGAMDTVMRPDVDIFADGVTNVPQYIAGETRTGTDGRFEITGVWPRAMYLLFAGIGSDAPTHQVLGRTPSPGEIVDLGDVVLNDAGVIVGTVVDEDGEPLAGALVRAADLPGTVAGFFPVERFDPEGAVLIRETGAPVHVVEMPAWVKDAFEHIPIPTTTTGADGAFRLVGVVPGSNLLATTAKDFLSDMKPSVQVRAGQEKNVGTIRLKHGEELIGKVLDTAGKPIADAEVIAGSTILIAPVDLARHVGKTNDAGEFSGLGFAPGNVTVAARRGPQFPWTLAEPQAISGDVVVTLPATFTVTFSVLLPGGTPAEKPRLKLIQGRVGDGAAEMTAFGFLPPIPLQDRLVQPKDAPWRIENLTAGNYTLLADAPGFATAFAGFAIVDQDASVQLQLTAKNDFAIRVQDVEGKPIRNAKIFAEGSGSRLFEMPLDCGRTNVDGRLVVDRIQSETLRVSADHPRFGVVHGQAKLGEELVLVMQPPGSITGIVLAGGKPVEPGKFTVMIEWRRGDGPRGPIETVPMMLSPGADGTFVAKALQPGTYRLQTINSLDAMRSPGGVMGMMTNMFMSNSGTRENATVVSGQATEVTLSTDEKPIEGPTAQLSGTVLLDGRLADGCFVQTQANGRRKNVKLDNSGRFDCGTVPAGSITVTVVAPDGGFGGMAGDQLWTGNFELKVSEARDVQIEILTTTVSGYCVGPDGSAMTGVSVTAHGHAKEQKSSMMWRIAPADAQGRFRFDRMPEGEWTFDVRGNRGSSRGSAGPITTVSGAPVADLRIEVRATISISGRIDLAPVAQQKSRWAWMSFDLVNPDGKTETVGHAGVNQDTGEFSTDDLRPGLYRVKVMFGTEQGTTEYRTQDLNVPPQGLKDLVLQLTRQ